MKKLLLSTILFSFFFTSGFGQCDQNQILLKKQGSDGRDWVKDYDNLSSIYGKQKKKISLLKNYFYDDKNKPKTCISYEDLKSLQSNLEIVFQNTPKPDKLVSELKATIAGIIKKNPKGFLTKTISDFSPSISDSTDDIIADNSGVIAEDSQISISDEKILKLEKDKNLWFWISIVSLAGFISLLVIYFFDRKRHSKEMALKNKTLKESEEKSFNLKKDDTTVFQIQIAILKKEKDNLEKEYSDFKNSLSKSNVEKQGDKEVVMQQNVTKIATQEVVPKQFYLSIPTPTDDGLGIFKDMRQVQANPTSSFYRFELDRDETKAKFWFLDNPNTIQSAIIYPETYINPVCDYEGFHSNAKNIATKMPGIAIKEGDTWKVLVKAKIRFE
jgi:hypothetical protein